MKGPGLGRRRVRLLVFTLSCLTALGLTHARTSAQADATAQAANAAARALESQASAREDLMRVLLAAGSDEERRALLLSKKDLVTVELRQALMKQGNAYLPQGNYALAMANYAVALAVAQQIGDTPGMAGAMNNMGVISLYRGDFDLAVDYQQKSLALRDPAVDQLAIADSLTNIGVANFSQGDYTLSMEYHNKALALREAAGARAAVAASLTNIANVYSATGNYVQAVTYLQKALTLGEAAGDKPVAASALANIGTVYYYQGDYDQALEHYQKGLALRVELGDNAGISREFNNLASVYQLQANYPLALEYYNKSLSLKETLDDKPGTARTLGFVGEVYTAQGDFDRALEYLQKSLTLSDGLGIKANTARVLGQIGLVHYSRKDYGRALEFAERATALATQVGDREQVWEARTTTGRARLALGQLPQARVALDEALATIEAIRSELAGGEQQQQSFFEGRVSPYHAMIDVLVAQKRFGDALTYAERAKARVLLDVLSRGKIEITKAMSAGDREQERKLNVQMVSRNAQVARESSLPLPDPARLSAFKADVQKARLDYDAFRAGLYATHPELSAQRGEALPVTLEETAGLLPDARSAVLEYVVADDKTYLFVLTKNHEGTAPAVDLRLYPLEVTGKDLAARTEAFRKSLGDRDLRFRGPARDLYDLLLKPAAAQLLGITTLIVVPDGVLWQLPFQALQAASGRYLLEDCAVSYVSSLTVLREMMKLPGSGRGDARGPATLFAMGNPALLPQTVAGVGGGVSLEPLPEAEKEARALGQLYGTTRSAILVGGQAREDRFKAEAGRYSVLHLATHAVLNDASPMYSHLVLSQTGGNTSEEDGLLEAREIMNLDLKARLVVLSACETARGRVTAGEGMIGLAWSFFVAGAPTTVVSQWKVDSASTTGLMLEFHRRLLTGGTPDTAHVSTADALRQAALTLLRSPQYRHPFYWAGFVVVGDGR